MSLGFGNNFGLKSQVLHHTKFLELKQTEPADGRPKWAYAHRPNAKDVVVIAPVIHKPEGDELILIETERQPLQAEGKAKRCIELPAGLVGDEKKGETVDEAIKKELLEETGYTADKVEIKAKNVASSPGCVSETSTIAVADITNLKQDKPVDDGGVIKAIYKVPLNKLSSWLGEQQKKGKSITAQAYAGLYQVVSGMSGNKQQKPAEEPSKISKA